MTISLAERREAGLWPRDTTHREERVYCYLHTAPSCITIVSLNLTAHTEILILPLVILATEARI